MNKTPITPPEGALLDLIESLGSLAWRKYQQRYPRAWINNKFQTVDDSGFPPFTSFRFEHEDAALVARLKEAVECFHGKVEWVMGEHKRIFSPGTNRVICPKRFWELKPIAEEAGMSVGQYMAEHEPTFGPVAYEDLLALTAYLRNIFGK